MPTEDEFEYFKSLSNMLKQLKDCTDFLSSEKSVRLDNSLYHVKLLVQGCKNMVHSYPVETYPVIGSFFKTLLSELDRRFPMEGAGIYPLAVGNILHPTWKGDLLPDAATRHEVINRLINEIEQNHMEEDVSATSQNLLQESLTPGTTRKRHSTPDPNDIFSSLQQKFQRMAEAKQQQCQQNQVRPLRCEFDLYMDDKNIPGLQSQGSTNHSPALSVESSDSEGDIIEPTLQEMSKRRKNETR